jgi:hypothetical protein
MVDILNCLCSVKNLMPTFSFIRNNLQLRKIALLWHKKILFCINF